ncbi:MAG TPA: ADP-ribosylglycohydrolase family protein [Desulfobacterales bacterium]|nr:ADP-ribosylglycohydrolase family protein [Desulfobacterales bacterium]
MLGAIAGDIIGSPYEFANFKEYEFPLFSENSTFTDDTVLTIAVADALIHDRIIVETFKSYTRRYPERGYGGSFIRWAFSDNPNPYNSWGNGSAMRTSSIGMYFPDPEIVLKNARDFAVVTHNHPEGIKGAQATAYAVFLANQGASKEKIKKEISSKFAYDLSRKIKEIRPNYHFDVSCMGTVPEAIISFLESENYEDAVRIAVSLGGDADTLACITGSIAEAYYGSVPEQIVKEVRNRLPQEFLEIIDEFYKLVSGIEIPS